MSLFGISSTEFVIIIVLAMLVIGPDKLPEYVARAREWVVKMRSMAEGARSQLKEQMGPDFEDVNWRQYDPRQYDPRTIVRQALFDQPAPAGATAAGTGSLPGDDLADRQPHDVPPTPEPVPGMRYDPDRMTPWDIDAT